MSLSSARLTALSSQTMALLLDREKGRRVDEARIKANMLKLKAAVRFPGTDEVRRQVDVMRGMLGDMPEDDEPEHEPYTDEPQQSTFHDARRAEEGRAYQHDDTDDMDDGQLFEAQQRVMADQDMHLDTLAASITRQHVISTEINGELHEHIGLLETLEEEVDTTASRLTSARRRMERVRQGVKGNVSTVTIGILILVLLILIVVFKT